MMVQSTNDKTECLVRQYLARTEATFRECMTAWTESPIEALMFAQLHNPVHEVPFAEPEARGRTFVEPGMVVPTYAIFSRAHESLRMVGAIRPVGRILINEDGTVTIAFQTSLQVGASVYRADMVMLAGDDKFIIELDGHDFHERTKAQATRDKRRDRSFTLRGWKVLRFTGSEVHADPEDVARQILAAGHMSIWSAESQEP